MRDLWDCSRVFVLRWERPQGPAISTNTSQVSLSYFLIVFLFSFLLSFAEQSELNKRLVLGCSHLPLCCPWPQPTSREIKTQPCYFYSVNKKQLQSSQVPNQLPCVKIQIQTFTERTDSSSRQKTTQCTKTTFRSIQLVGRKGQVWHCGATRTKVILLTYIIWSHTVHHQVWILLVFVNTQLPSRIICYDWNNCLAPERAVTLNFTVFGTI